MNSSQIANRYEVDVIDWHLEMVAILMVNTAHSPGPINRPATVILTCDSITANPRQPWVGSFSGVHHVDRRREDRW